MKKLVFMLALLLCAACQQRVQQQPAEEEVKEEQPAFDESLIIKQTDSITYRTTVTYAGLHKQGDLVLSAIYGMDEFDSFGEKLLTPEVDVFQLTMHLKHNGAFKPETIVLVTDGKPHKLEPNFIQAVASGEFMLLFNYDIVRTRSIPKDIINAKSIQVKVRYNNGDAVYNVTEEDQKAVETVFLSYLKDGGKDWSLVDEAMEEYNKMKEQA